MNLILCSLGEIVCRQLKVNMLFEQSGLTYTTECKKRELQSRKVKHIQRGRGIEISEDLASLLSRSESSTGLGGNNGTFVWSVPKAISTGINRKY